MAQPDSIARHPRRRIDDDDSPLLWRLALAAAGSLLA
jgi:hypothetical protein